MVGVLFGFFGMGGSFLVTPALLVRGYPAKIAVGSGLAFVFGTSVVGALVYARTGAVVLPVVGSLLVGSAFGARIGAGASTHVDED